jgi:transposase
MMGHKARIFDHIHALTLEELVPEDHFYRHLERSLDVSFVRKLVTGCYAPAGRSSIDPVVFFKLQLVLFVEGLRSERQLLAHAADRLSVRWYLVYDLDEPLPDHSSLTRIRDRYGLEVLRRFFDVIVEQCRAAGLVWGHEFYIDATQVHANASLDSVLDRSAVGAHLTGLFLVDADVCDTLSTELTELALDLPDAQRIALEDTNASRHDWIAQTGQQQREVRHGAYHRVSDAKASLADPDATLLPSKGGRSHLGYHVHEVVDGGRARIILTVLTTPSEVMENQPALDLIWHTCFRWRQRPHQVTGDTTYATGENIRALEDADIRAYLPLADWDRTPRYGPSHFRYDAGQDVFRCPEGQLLTRDRAKCTERVVVYRADPSVCNV